MRPNIPIPSPISLGDRERFETKLDRSGECWIWKAHVSETGYGRFKLANRCVMAHRVSYTLYVGAIPDGLEVLHNCPGGDNPSCCNPAHLRVGTQAENIADMVTKGRTCKGVDHRDAKLTEANVLSVYQRRLAGESVSQIARAIGSSSCMTSAILMGRKWAHLHPARNQGPDGIKAWVARLPQRPSQSTFSAEKIAEVVRLRTEGWNLDDIAAATGVGKSSLRKYIRRALGPVRKYVRRGHRPSILAMVSMDASASRSSTDSALREASPEKSKGFDPGCWT